MIRRPPSSPLFPYPPLFGSHPRHLVAFAQEGLGEMSADEARRPGHAHLCHVHLPQSIAAPAAKELVVPLRFSPRATRTVRRRDRKSTRLNSSHLVISYAVFC